MEAHEHLRLAIENERSRLRASIPDDLEGALVALVHHLDNLPPGASMMDEPDVLTGRRLIDAGGNLALALVLGSRTIDLHSATGGVEVQRWSDWFLPACDRLALAELALMQVEAGALRLMDDGDATFVAWPISPRPIASIGERLDWDWWAEFSERQLRASSGSPTPVDWSADDGSRREGASRLVMRMAYQLCYPESAELCGISLQRCRDVLGVLISRVMCARQAGVQACVESRRKVVSDIAAELGDRPADIDDLIAALSLDADVARDHAAVPGVASAPILCLGEDRIILSRPGLLSHPLLFLARALRRRDAQSYHNASHLREDAFRHDLATLFANRRFVCSESQIRLRRHGGTLRTDIDFTVFDRKSGALGLFELKAQDPFARSAEELARQRDNVLDANRQVAATLDWVSRHGADEILNRIDRGTAKRFRVRKVFPFVLGRYLVHFHDGPAPSSRAAWGTWPEVLRIGGDDDRFAAGQSPIATLFARLSSDGGARSLVANAPSRTIDLGQAQLEIHPSYAAYQRASH